MSNERLTDHIIVCGATPLALMAAEAALNAKRSCIIVSPRAAEAAERQSTEAIWHEGDPADDSVLLAVGVREAYGLICALEEDRDSLFVCTTARYLNPHMHIVALATDPDVREKLLLAGANRVVWSSHVIGMRMTSEMIRPVSVQFLDAMIKDHSVDPQIGHVVVPAGSPLHGKALRDAGIISRFGLLVAAIGKAGGSELVYDPAPTTAIEEGDLLVVFGREAEIEGLRALLVDGEA